MISMAVIAVLDTMLLSTTAVVEAVLVVDSRL
jgi:hypothetical protein